MKKNTRILILTLLGVLGFATIAKAKNWFDDELNQKIVQLGTYGLIDYKQTATAIYNPPSGKRFVEINPILGERPERKELAAFGLGGIGIVYILKEALPDNWKKAKEILIDSVLSTEQFNIEENQRVSSGQKRQAGVIPIILTIRW